MNKTGTYIGIIGILLILASIIYTYNYAPIKNGSTIDLSLDGNLNSNNETDTVAKNDIKIFSDPSELFSFEYPENLVLSAGPVGNTIDWRVGADNTILGLLKAVVTIPKIYEPNTNFSDAKFTVGVSTNQKAIANCFVAQGGNGVKKSEATINGVKFTKIEFTGAGAGNLYKTTSYRTVRDGQCIAVEYTVHSTNLGNYSPDQGITAYDEAKINKVLEGITESFKFLANGNGSATGGSGIISDGTKSGAGTVSGGTNVGINIDVNAPPKQVTVEGTFICLPHKDTGGPQTTECAYGIKETKTGANFALDTRALNPTMNVAVSSEVTFRVTGLLVPIEQLSADQWNKYNMKGIIRANIVIRSR